MGSTFVPVYSLKPDQATCKVGPVQGLAHLNDERVVVLSAGSKAIATLSDQQSRFRAADHDIQLPDAVRPCDLAATSGYIFVVDHVGNCVWRTSETGRNVAKFVTCLNKSTSSDAILPWSISATSSGCLLLITDNGYLLVFDNAAVCSDVVAEEEYKLPCHVIALQGYVEPSRVEHAVETPRGTYVVCYSAASDSGSNGRSQDDSGGVIEIDRRGNLLNAYTSNEIFSPGYLTLARGHVLVADRRPSAGALVSVLNDRLELIAKLELHGARYRGNSVDVVSKDAVSDCATRVAADDVHAKRLCYSEKSGRLYVGFLNGGVNAYNLDDVCSSLFV